MYIVTTRGCDFTSILHHQSAQTLWACKHQCLLGPLVLVCPKCLALCYALIILLSLRTRLDFRVVNLDSLHRWHSNSLGMLDLRIFAQDKWIQVRHVEHSIMGRPANGFMQKHVIRSFSSSEITKKIKCYLSPPKQGQPATAAVQQVPNCHKATERIIDINSYLSVCQSVSRSSQM